MESASTWAARFSLLSDHSHEGQGSMESLELTLSGCKLYLRQDDLSSCMTFPVGKEEHPPGRILRNFANIRVRGQGTFVELHI